MLSQILNKIFDDSDQFFDRFEIEIKKSLTKYLLGSLITNGNKLELSSQNLIVINSIKTEEKNANRAIEFIQKSLLKILKNTFKRYKEYDDDLDSNVKGFLERFDGDSNTVLDDYYNLIRTRAVEAIARGGTLDQIYELVDQNQVGYKHFAAHIYSSYQRDAANNLRKKIGLQYAIYEGGTINTTRDFCRNKNGKVYHETEISSWTSEDWQGKSKPYNPFIHLGGYNCRHWLNWISDDLAEYLKNN